MSKKILIVEDEWIIADDIRERLESMGYEVVAIVSSGEETISHAEDADLILLDIFLNGTMDGIETAEKIHAQSTKPIVFLTAYAEKEIIERAKKAEPFGYILKPFESKELYATIEMALYKHEVEMQLMASKEYLEKKIEDRFRRTEILLETRRLLQRETDWDRGLLIIAEGITNLGFKGCAVFLVDPTKNTLDYHIGWGEGIPVGNPSVSLNSLEYFGVRCVVEKKTVHIEDSTSSDKKQILPESQSFVWVPIIVQNEAFAAIKISSTHKNPISKEDVKDIEIFASICAAFIDRTRPSIESYPEDTLASTEKPILAFSEGYLIVEKKPIRSFEIFLDLVTHGVPGLIISREHPSKIQKTYHFKKTPIIWLSRSKTEDTISPDSISKLIYIFRDFAGKNEKSVILLDGVEYLISQAGFEKVLMYLQELKDVIILNNSCLLIPFHKEVLPVEAFSMLETEFIIFTG